MEENAVLAQYGYRDASGDFFITIDGALCDGCGMCSDACPAGVFIVVEREPREPRRTEPVAAVDGEKKDKLKYECNPCKPFHGKMTLPCVASCKKIAISHSW